MSSPRPWLGFYLQGPSADEADDVFVIPRFADTGERGRSWLLEVIDKVTSSESVVLANAGISSSVERGFYVLQLEAATPDSAGRTMRGACVGKLIDIQKFRTRDQWAGEVLATAREFFGQSDLALSDESEHQARGLLLKLGRGSSLVTRRWGLEGAVKAAVDPWRQMR